MAPHSILQVNAFHRESTGADRYVADLSELLRSRGHRVAPLCARHPGDDPSEWERYFPEGARTAPADRAGPLRAVADAAKFLFHLDARRRAAEIVRDFRPDVVHVHNLYHHLSPSVLGPLRASGAPVVMTLEDYKLICPSYTLHTQGRLCTACRGGRFWNAVRFRCVRDSRPKSALCAAENALHRGLGLYLRGVDRFVAPSRFVAERFVEFGFPGERISVVPHFTPLPAADQAAEGDFVLFAGRLVATKGVLTLLRAWKETRARRELRLLVAGDGPLAGTLARFAEENGLGEVRLLGLQRRHDLETWMSRAVVVVVPSEWWEPFGLVILEAQARGRCVVASRIGGIPEIVTDEETGLLVPPGDARQLAAAIDAAAESPDLRRRLGEAARRRVEARYGPSVHYEALLSVYRGDRCQPFVVACNKAPDP